MLYVALAEVRVSKLISGLRLSEIQKVQNSILPCKDFLLATSPHRHGHKNFFHFNLSLHSKKDAPRAPLTNLTAYILHPRKRKNRYQFRYHFRYHFRSAAKYRTAISTNSLRLLRKVIFPIWRLSMTRSHVLACRYRSRRISSISFLAGSRT